MSITSFKLLLALESTRWCDCVASERKQVAEKFLSNCEVEMILINFTSFRFDSKTHWHYLVAWFCVCILFQLSFYAFTSSLLPSPSRQDRFYIIFSPSWCLIFSPRAHRIHATRFCLYWDVCWSLITSPSPIAIGIGQLRLSSLFARFLSLSAPTPLVPDTQTTCIYHGSRVFLRPLFGCVPIYFRWGSRFSSEHSPFYLLEGSSIKRSAPADLANSLVILISFIPNVPTKVHRCNFSYRQPHWASFFHSLIFSLLRARTHS